VGNSNCIIDDICIESKTLSALILVLHSSIYYLISLSFHHAFKHSVAFMMSSDSHYIGRLRSYDSWDIGSYLISGVKGRGIKNVKKLQIADLGT
jgi:hypothetical protein